MTDSAVVDAPKKKTAKKRGAKKGVKKGAKKAAKKEGGLTKRETAILETLSRNSKPLTRSQLKEKSEITSGLSKLLGASTKDNLGASGKDSLEGRGLIKAEKHEGERGIVYSITAAGRKAIGK